MNAYGYPKYCECYKKEEHKEKKEEHKEKKEECVEINIMCPGKKNCAELNITCDDKQKKSLWFGDQRSMLKAGKEDIEEVLPEEDGIMDEEDMNDEVELRKAEDSYGGGAKGDLAAPEYIRPQSALRAAEGKKDLDCHQKKEKSCVVINVICKDCDCDWD